MPRANQDRYNPLVRIPRTLFQHFHEDGDANFPPVLPQWGNVATFLLLPDNWNGTDKIIIWLKGVDEGQGGIDVGIYAGTCEESQATHSDEGNTYTPTFASDEYECIDITADIAAFIAALTARDMVKVVVQNTVDMLIKAIGVEIQET